MKIILIFAILLVVFFCGVILSYLFPLDYLKHRNPNIGNSLEINLNNDWNYHITVMNFSNIRLEFVEISLINPVIDIGNIAPWGVSSMGTYSKIPVSTMSLKWKYDGDETIYLKNFNFGCKDLLPKYSNSFRSFLFCVTGNDCFLGYQFKSFFSDGRLAGFINFTEEGRLMDLTKEEYKYRDMVNKNIIN